MALKKQRQHLITQLLTENFVGSREQLISLLKDEGVNATQATVSKDLDELGQLWSEVTVAQRFMQSLSCPVRGMFTKII